MDFDQPTSQLWLGGAVGLISAVITIWLQLRLATRKTRKRAQVLPGCVMLVSGYLGATGLFMAAASMIFTGGLGLAIAPGLGVLLGFFVGSVVMILLRRSAAGDPDSQ